MSFRHLIYRLTYAPKFSSVGPGLEVTGRIKIRGKGEKRAGKNFLIKTGCELFADKTATIIFGDNVHLGYNVGVAAQKQVEIGDEARIGDGSIIVDTDWHGFDGNPPKVMPVKLGFHVWLGLNAMVLKGVTIGDYAIIGAGTVVTSNIPANTIVAGNPAKKIGETKTGHTI
jgi:acetyltransferase-like isoleucine patch superfamily enzyme